MSRATYLSLERVELIGIEVAAPAVGANEAILFQTLHQLNHPAFRITSQLGEKRHFYLAPAPVGRLRAGRRDQHAIQSGLCRRHGSQQELKVDLRHAFSTFPDLNGSLTDLDHRICSGRSEET